MFHWFKRFLPMLGIIALGAGLAACTEATSGGTAPVTSTASQSGGSGVQRVSMNTSGQRQQLFPGRDVTTMRAKYSAAGLGPRSANLERHRVCWAMFTELYNPDLAMGATYRQFQDTYNKLRASEEGQVHCPPAL